MNTWSSMLQFRGTDVVGCFGGRFSAAPGRSRLVEYYAEIGYVYDPRYTWVALAIALLAVGLGLWGWYADAWRRRPGATRRCPRCRYDLSGIADDASYPLRCSECACEIASASVFDRPRRSARLLALSVIVVLVAHVMARGPEVERGGWIVLVPTTALAMAPIDPASWADVPPHGGAPTPSQAELRSRLLHDPPRWQVRMLLSRIEQASRGRGDYGINDAQRDAVSGLERGAILFRGQETAAERVAAIAEASGVPIRVDWTGSPFARVRPGDPVPPTEGTAMDALTGLCRYGWSGDAAWDLALDGTVVIGDTRIGTRCRIYAVADLADGVEAAFDINDAITAVIDPDTWVSSRGSRCTATPVTDHIIVAAPARVHVQIERLLEALRAASRHVYEPIPHDGPLHLGAVPMAPDHSGGFLGGLRHGIAVTLDVHRAARPTFADGVTEPELDACGRSGFGLLDRMREPPATER